MKKLVALMLVLCMVVALVACSAKTETKTETKTDTPAETKTDTPAETKAETTTDAKTDAPAEAAAYTFPKVFIVNTTGSTSTAYAQTLAWATVMEKNTGMAIRLLPEDSNNTKFKRVKAHEVDCMYDTMTDVATLIQATGGFQTADGGPFAIRNLWIDSIQVGLLATRGDSKLNSILDITPSTRIAYWPDPTNSTLIDAISAACQVPRDQMTLVPCSTYADQIKMVGEGNADVCPYITSSSSALIEAAANPKGIKILELNPETMPDVITRWRTVYPIHGFNKAVSGWEGAVGKYGMSNYAGVWTSADEDVNLVYNMTKFFVEHAGEIVPTFDTFQYYWNLDTYMEFANNAVIPLHDGVVKYLTEIGKWTPELQARQDYNVKLLDWYTELYQQAVKDAQAQGIKVGLDSPEWDAFWAKVKEDAGIPVIVIMSDEQIASAKLNH